jgi:hypothetical protein
MIYHRDIGGSPHWYDILATMGHHSQTQFHLPSLDTTFSYKLGTVVAIAEKIIPHSVDEIEDGNWVCFVWFMQEDIRKYLHIPEGQLSTQVGIMSAAKPLAE